MVNDIAVKRTLREIQLVKRSVLPRKVTLEMLRQVLLQAESFAAEVALMRTPQPRLVLLQQTNQEKEKIPVTICHRHRNHRYTFSIPGERNIFRGTPQLPTHPKKTRQFLDGRQSLEHRRETLTASGTYKKFFSYNKLPHSGESFVFFASSFLHITSLTRKDIRILEFFVVSNHLFTIALSNSTQETDLS